MRSSIQTILLRVFISLFCTGTIVGLIGRGICVRDNQKYQTKQPELFAPDEIATALRDESNKQLYICYNDASYVNVYSENGEFLWAVSTPYLRNAYFEISNDWLIIYNSTDAYIYNALNGDFIEKKASDLLELHYDWENTSTDTPQSGEFYFDTYQVYRAENDGSLTTIVSRPWWYWIFHFSVCWCVSFCSAVGLGILFFLEKRKDYRAVVKRRSGSRNKIIIENRKGRFILNYFKIVSAIHLIYAVLDILFGIWFDGILCIGILPLAIHFIISNGIFGNMLDCLRVSENEKKIIDYWQNFELGSFIVAFFSVVIVAMLV